MDNQQIASYISSGITRMIHAVRSETVLDWREKRFLLRQTRIQKRKIRCRNRQNVHVPPFLIASITERCNLHCTGCYARGCGFCTDAPKREMLSLTDWQRIFHEADAAGVSFILLTGGEPLMNREIIELAARERNLIFPVFTNGTLLNESVISLFVSSRNLFPVFSLEGSRETTDRRRGQGVFAACTNAAESLRQNGVLFGISITVSRDNLQELTSETFLPLLQSIGPSVVFLIEYTATSDGDKDKELTAADRQAVADWLTKARITARSIWFMSFPGDEELMGGCLAAGRGFFHINPYGDAEPCPFAPVSACNLKTASLTDALQSPLFYHLSASGMLADTHDGGCALAGKKDQIEALLVQK